MAKKVTKKKAVTHRHRGSFTPVSQAVDPDDYARHARTFKLANFEQQGLDHYENLRRSHWTLARQVGELAQRIDMLEHRIANQNAALDDLKRLPQLISNALIKAGLV